MAVKVGAQLLNLGNSFVRILLCLVHVPSLHRVHHRNKVDQDAEVIFLGEVPSEVESLRVLTAKLNMDFGAADFKSDPQTGKLVFLELNTSPMFARFNQVSQGALCTAMLKTLLSIEGND